MSAMGVLLIGLGFALVWSAMKNEPLFVGDNAVVPAVLRGERK